MPLILINPQKPASVEPEKVSESVNNLPVQAAPRVLQQFKRPIRRPPDGPMLVVGGREKKISGSSAYLLDMLCID